jgi:two-component system nitrate/nitrite response regulator NarL
VEVAEMAARCVNIVVAAHEPVVLCGLIAMLRAEPDFKVVAICRDGVTCLQAIRDLSPDLALLDSSLPRQGGLRVLASVKSEQLGTRVIFLSASAHSSNAANLMGRGAYGVLSKEASPEVLVRCLREVPEQRWSSGRKSRNGHDPRSHPATESPSNALTRRERQVMNLVCEGLSNKDIGRQFNLSDGTVKVHLHHIYEKLAIRNRTALAMLAAGDSEASRRNGASNGWAFGRERFHAERKQKPL